MRQAWILVVLTVLQGCDVFLQDYIARIEEKHHVVRLEFSADGGQLFAAERYVGGNLIDTGDWRRLLELPYGAGDLDLDSGTVVMEDADNPLTVRRCNLSELEAEGCAEGSLLHFEQLNTESFGELDLLPGGEHMVIRYEDSTEYLHHKLFVDMMGDGVRCDFAGWRRIWSVENENTPIEVIPDSHLIIAGVAYEKDEYHVPQWYQIELRDASTCELRSVLLSGTMEPIAIRSSKDGTRLAVVLGEEGGGSSFKLVLFGLPEERVLAVRSYLGPSTVGQCLGWSADGRYLALSRLSFNQIMRAEDLATVKFIRHDSFLSAVAFSPDLMWLVSAAGYYESDIRVWPLDLPP